MFSIVYFHTRFFSRECCRDSDRRTQNTSQVSATTTFLWINTTLICCPPLGCFRAGVGQGRNIFLSLPLRLFF